MCNLLPTSDDYITNRSCQQEAIPEEIKFSSGSLPNQDYQVLQFSTGSCSALSDRFAGSALKLRFKRFSSKPFKLNPFASVCFVSHSLQFR
jgi:hypothetical protein